MTHNLVSQSQDIQEHNPGDIGICIIIVASFDWNSGVGLTHTPKNKI